MRVKLLAQEHNTMSPARARIQTARSRDEQSNHEATNSFIHDDTYIHTLLTSPKRLFKDNNLNLNKYNNKNKMTKSTLRILKKIISCCS